MQGFADLEDGVLMALGPSPGRWKVKKTGIEFVVSNFVIAFQPEPTLMVGQRAPCRSCDSCRSPLKRDNQAMPSNSRTYYVDTIDPIDI